MDILNYPLSGFYFQLSFISVWGVAETSFKEVSGISMEMGMEEIAEGGENRFKHRVPTGAKYQNLVLKRGFMTLPSPLALWCQSTIGGGLGDQITTYTVVVNLLSDLGIPIKTWSFANAWPVKWEITPFNSMNNEIVIESLELSYSYFTEII